MKIRISECPELMNQWHPTKNQNLDPTKLTVGSTKTVWWKCEKGEDHEWPATPAKRFGSGEEYGTGKEKPRGCPFCARKKPCKDYNFAVIKPQYVKDWHPNNPRPPESYLPTSHEVVNWRCHICKFEYPLRLEWRADNSCPHCNSIERKVPHLVQYWNSEKNTGYSLATTGFSSGKEFWWKCINCDYEWKEKPNLLNKKNPDKVCTKCQSLGMLFPHLIEEWDPKNPKSPYDYWAFSDEYVSWICTFCDNKWTAQIKNRANGTGCNKCKDQHGTSFPEQTIAYYLEKVMSDVHLRETEDPHLCGQEIDIWIPSLPLGIEYDGNHHQNRVEKDEEKSRLMQGIPFIRVRDTRLPEINVYGAHVIYHKYGKDRALMVCIRQLFSLIGELFPRLEQQIKSLDINIPRDTNAILERMYKYPIKNSISNMYPEVAKDWDYEKNGNNNPAFIPYGSNKTVHWKCSKCGHCWPKQIQKRTIGNTGCNQCRKNKPSGIYPEISPGKTVIDWMFELRQGGRTLQEIADELNNAGYSSLTDKPFTKSIISHEIKRYENMQG